MSCFFIPVAAFLCTIFKVFTDFSVFLFKSKLHWISHRNTPLVKRELTQSKQLSKSIEREKTNQTNPDPISIRTKLDSNSYNNQQTNINLHPTENRKTTQSVDKKKKKPTLRKKNRTKCEQLTSRNGRAGGQEKRIY